MKPTPKQIQKANRLVCRLYEQFKKTQYELAVVGTPVRRISFSVDEENDLHMRVTYFKLPKL